MPGPGVISAPATAWTFAAGAAARFSPVLADGVLYWSAEGTSFAIDAATGQEIWRTAGSQSLMTIGDGIVYLISDDGSTLDARDAATQELLWQVSPAAVTWTPLLVGDVIYYGSAPNLLVALDAKTGDHLWVSQLDGEASRSVALSGSTLVVGAVDGNVYAIDSGTGVTLWTFETGMTGSLQTPAILNNTVIIGTFGEAKNALFALDLNNGAQLWRRDGEGTEGFYAAGADGDSVFVPSDLGRFYALDVSTGETRWTMTAQRPLTSAPAIVDGIVYVAGDDGVVRALSASDGNELWRKLVVGSVEFGPIVSNGYVYLCTTSGMLYALGAASGSSGSTTSELTPTVEPTAGPPIAQLLWTSKGDPELELSTPTQLAVAPDGNIWVVDGMSDVIQIFSPDGAVVDTFGESGSGPGQFHFRRVASDPWGAVVFAPDGSFFVMDTGNGRIQKFDPQRNFVLEITSANGQLGRITKPVMGFVSPDDRLFVIGFIDDSSGGWEIFDLDGEHLGEWPVEDNIGTLAPDGFVWIGSADRARIVRVDLDGRVRSTWGKEGSAPDQLGRPEVAVGDGIGHVFVPDMAANSIKVFDEGGNFIGLIGSEGNEPGQFLKPYFIALDGAGNLYVCDGQNGRLQKFKLLPPLVE
jgi:outer membrane protein assembly factor BamB/streptogramin lyase